MSFTSNRIQAKGAKTKYWVCVNKVVSVCVFYITLRVCMSAHLCQEAAVCSPGISPWAPRGAVLPFLQHSERLSGMQISCGSSLGLAAYFTMRTPAVAEQKCALCWQCVHPAMSRRPPGETWGGSGSWLWQLCWPPTPPGDHRRSWIQRYWTLLTHPCTEPSNSITCGNFVRFGRKHFFFLFLEENGI